MPWDGWVGWGGWERKRLWGDPKSRPAWACLAQGALKNSRTDVEPVRLCFAEHFVAFSIGADRRGSFGNAGSALRAAKGAPEGEIFGHRARVGAGEAPGAELSRSRTVVSFLDKTLSKTPYAGRKNKMLIVILQA